ncbi:TIM barrel protein [Micromonospora zamorensis]|uniref:TIM barrel protein n=1 Tax=Micromonospora zamorensis TaxID=709883 RepID=UPI0033C798DC
MLTAHRDSPHDHVEETPERPRAVIATGCLSGTLEDKLAAAAAARFQGIEIFESDLIASPWSPRRVRQECARRGLSIDVYQPFRDFEAVAPEVFRANLRRAERTFDVIEQLGAGTMLVASSTSADAVDDDDLAAEQLNILAGRAEQRGLRIAYEALAWGRFVNTYAHSWRIIRRAGHPALGLCLDSFHVLSRGDDPAGIRVIPGSKVFHVQLADAPRLTMDVVEWSWHHRLFPGLGSFDLPGFLGHVLTTGYDGPLSLEVFNDVYRQADPRHAAIDGMRALVALREAVSTSGPPAARERLRMNSLPPAPQLGGHAFTELAVDDRSGSVVARTLTALGFAHTGQHRSKPVQLWEQGRARILLNFAAHRAVPPVTAAVCALGLESTDPAGSAQRAERLLAPVLPRLRRPEEADLASVAAPDGTVVFLVQSADSGSWLEDFSPTGTSPRSDGLLTGIDHVSLTESVDDFDEAAIFYRTVLGLHAGEATEIAAPFGLIRTRTASDLRQRVRITLNTAPLRRGDWSPAVPSPQHIAFGSDDVVASARAMRALGAPILRIPDNYYVDLDARLDPPPELLSAMRDLSILYDRDERGEYLHFYTEILGSRVFFEVVQRIEGYLGYGAATSVPVRMAAHRERRLITLRDVPAPRNDERHDYSLAHLTALSLSPPDLVDAAAEAGYRYVGLRLTRVTPQEPHYPLATDPALMRTTKVRLAATGVEVLDIELARISPDDDPREFLRFLEAGAELGARHVIAQLPDPDRARKIDRYAQLCELARPLGLTVDLEFPSWTETPDLREAVRVLRGADQPNVGMLIDLLHFARSGSSVDDLRQLPVDWFHFVHVCDAPPGVPATNEGLIHTARFERLFPGEGGIDVHGILDALPPGLPYALEIPRATLVAQVGAREHARLAITAARDHLDRSNGTPVGQPSGVLPGTSR